MNKHQEFRAYVSLYKFHFSPKEEKEKEKRAFCTFYEGEKKKRRKKKKGKEITQKRKDRRCTSSDESRTKTISQWRHHLFCDSLTHRLIGIRQTYPGLEPDTAAKPDLIPMASHLSPFQFHSWTWQFPLPDRRYLPPSFVPFVCEIAIFSIVSRNARSFHPSHSIRREFDTSSWVGWISTDGGVSSCRWFTSDVD